MFITLVADAHIEPTPLVYESGFVEPERVVLIGTTTQEVLKNERENNEVLKCSAQCESGNRQFNTNGTVVSNPHSTAVGKYQIMASLHAENAMELGWNIYTEEGNENFAQHLFETQGTTPWDSSKDCWSKVY